VLKVFEQERIPIHIIVGTSSGALIGGAFASGIGADELREKVDEYINSPQFLSSAFKAFETVQAQNILGFTQRIQCYFRNNYYVVAAMLRPGILPEKAFDDAINHFIPDIGIEETEIAFRAVSTDLVTGEQVVLSEGSLRQAIKASCAVPVALAPVRSGERLLSDGGIISLIPSSVARREDADLVVAVNVSGDIATERELRNALSIYQRVSEIMAHQIENNELAEADIVIRPDVGNLHWCEFSQALSLIEEGEKAARERLEDIKRATPGGKKWFTLKQLLKPLMKNG
jgi:NTE family protein